eukprot:12892701-Prorocentrum_lima.AAC.1
MVAAGAPQRKYWSRRASRHRQVEKRERASQQLADMLARPSARRRRGGPRPPVQVTAVQVSDFWGEVWGRSRPEPE